MTVLRSTALAAVLAMTSVVVVGCGEPPEGPAANVFLQIVRGDPALDTSDVTGFVVIVGGARNVVPFDENTSAELALVAPPAVQTPFVVYACTTRTAACQEANGVFIGCTVTDVVAGDSAVRVELLPITPLPAACVGVPGAPVVPAG